MGAVLEVLQPHHSKFRVLACNHIFHLFNFVSGYVYWFEDMLYIICTSWNIALYMYIANLIPHDIIGIWLRQLSLLWKSESYLNISQGFIVKKEEWVFLHTETKWALRNLERTTHNNTKLLG